MPRETITLPILTTRLQYCRHNRHSCVVLQDFIIIIISASHACEDKLECRAQSQPTCSPSNLKKTNKQQRQWSEQQQLRRQTSAASWSVLREQCTLRGTINSDLWPTGKSLRHYENDKTVLSGYFPPFSLALAKFCAAGNVALTRGGSPPVTGRESCLIYLFTFFGSLVSPFFLVTAFHRRRFHALMLTGPTTR